MMHLNRRCSAALLALSALMSAVLAQEPGTQPGQPTNPAEPTPPAKPELSAEAVRKDRLQKYLEVCKAKEQFAKRMEVSGKILASNPQIPPEFPARFIKAAKFEDAMKIQEPLLLKHYSDDILDALIAFGATPAGAKLNAQQGDIASDAFEASFALGFKFGQAYVRRQQGEEVDDVTMPELPEHKLNAKVIEYLDVSGALEMEMGTFDRAVVGMAQSGTPEDYIEGFKKLFVSKEALRRLYVPIFVKHLDEATLDAVNTFFKSDAGRRVAKATVALMAEVQPAMEKWGQELGTKVYREMQAERDEQ